MRKGGARGVDVEESRRNARVCSGGGMRTSAASCAGGRGGEKMSREEERREDTIEKVGSRIEDA